MCFFQFAASDFDAHPNIKNFASKMLESLRSVESAVDLHEVFLNNLIHSKESKEKINEIANKYGIVLPQAFLVSNQKTSENVVSAEAEKTNESVVNAEAENSADAVVHSDVGEPTNVNERTNVDETNKDIDDPVDFVVPVKKKQHSDVAVKNVDYTVKLKSSTKMVLLRKELFGSCSSTDNEFKESNDDTDADISSLSDDIIDTNKVKRSLRIEQKNKTKASTTKSPRKPLKKKASKTDLDDIPLLKRLKMAQKSTDKKSDASSVSDLNSLEKEIAEI